MWSTEYRYYTNNASESWSNKATPRFNELVKQENENRMKYEEKVKDNNVDKWVDRFMHITNEESESDDEQCSEKDNEDNITWGTPIEVWNSIGLWICCNEFMLFEIDLMYI